MRWTLLAEAETAARQGLALAPDSPIAASSLGYVCARIGKRAEARRIVDNFIEQWRRSRTSALLIPPIEAALGDIDAAFAWIERAIADRSDKVVYLKVAPFGDLLRADPRFPRMLKRIGLE